MNLIESRKIFFARSLKLDLAENKRKWKRAEKNENTPYVHTIAHLSTGPYPWYLKIKISYNSRNTYHKKDMKKDMLYMYDNLYEYPIIASIS